MALPRRKHSRTQAQAAARRLSLPNSTQQQHGAGGVGAIMALLGKRRPIFSVPGVDWPAAQGGWGGLSCMRACNVCACAMPHRSCLYPVRVCVHMCVCAWWYAAPPPSPTHPSNPGALRRKGYRKAGDVGEAATPEEMSTRGASMRLCGCMRG